MLDTATNLKDMLNDPSLLATDAYLAGDWVAADNGTRFPVTNPARGDILAEVPEIGRAET